jgi:hypothetical protein
MLYMDKCLSRFQKRQEDAILKFLQLEKERGQKSPPEKFLKFVLSGIIRLG